MSSRRPRALCAPLALAFAVGGCFSSQELPKSASHLTAPLFDSPEEFANVQIASVDLCPTGFASTVTFDTADQLFGIAVQVAADGPATFAATGNPALDTQLFVFGPADASGYYGEIPVGADDDSGDGLQSRIDETLTAGTWFVVITTSGGDGLGTVTLTGSGACSSGEDVDQDGVDDAIDNCPLVANPDQADGDGDGAGDACDDSSIPCIDGQACSYTDLDGTTCTSMCSNGACIEMMNALGQCIIFGDVDGDGVMDDVDNCPGYNPDQIDANGDGIGDACQMSSPTCAEDGDCTTIDAAGHYCSGDCEGGVCVSLPTDCVAVDSDGDGVFDAADNCPIDANGDQADSDGDGIGDACEDDNACVDGQSCTTVGADGQVCPGTCANGTCAIPPGGACGGFLDGDGDGVPDGVDNCPDAANGDQADQDGDGVGDACDADPNNDGFVCVDGQACTYTGADGQLCDGTCANGTCAIPPGGGCGGAPDGDGDGVPDGVDNCPDGANGDQADQDGDGVGDACDADPGNDGGFFCVAGQSCSYTLPNGQTCAGVCQNGACISNGACN